MSRHIILLIVAALWSSAAANAQPRPADARGAILVEYWDDMPGYSIAEAQHARGFPNSPERNEQRATFEIPAGETGAYTALARGYVTAPATGDYTFWIAGDDASALYLSPSEDPAQKRLVAQSPDYTEFRQWDKHPEQKSRPISLVAGRRYCIEAILKQGGGNAHLSVGWQLPDKTMERPIPGNRLTSATPSRLGVSTITATLDKRQPLAAKFGHHKFPAGATIHGKTDFAMSYLMFLPKNYDTTKDRKALFVFLCGNTHQGSDLRGILNEGPAQYLEENPKLRDWFPMVALFPQPPVDTRWDSPGMPKAVVALIDEVVKAYRIDPDRVYLSGLSMGGKGTWLVAQACPERFAAIAPISAVDVDPEQAPKSLRNVATWVICGGDDGGFTEGSEKMRASFAAVNVGMQFTRVPSAGHDVWGRYYPEPSFYEWLARWHRTDGGRKPPTSRPS